MPLVLLEEGKLLSSPSLMQTAHLDLALPVSHGTLLHALHLLGFVSVHLLGFKCFPWPCSA